MKLSSDISSTPIWKNLTVWVAALGYFVDMFDISLFGVVRTASLKSLGVTDPAEILSQGIHLYNMQMIGMMVGGILWGVLADKKGRLQVMFGSILLYSIGNLANAFVPNVELYAICRFITGVGLAGELGAAITIVAESLPKEKRGIGTTLVATLGLLGSVTAAFVGQQMNWQFAYILGGVLGLFLLLARVKVSESGLFEKLKKTQEKMSGSQTLNNFKILFRPKNFWKYICCIFMGMPIYFMTGILFTFSPEITKSLNVIGEVTAGNALLYGSIGLALGDLFSGLTSQLLRSRKKAIGLSLALAIALSFYYLQSSQLEARSIYILCFALGICAGYWAVLVTVAAEQFGTNLRGTVATTVPNFVRGSAVFVTLGFAALKTGFGISQAAMLIGGLWFLLSFIGLFFLEETFSKELDYLET